MPTTAVPKILSDPGFLFYAPTGTSLPTNTVVGSKFTDAWPVGWISAGATEDGSSFKYESNIEPVRVAEFFDPIRYSTTERSGSLAFNMASWELAKIKFALNGGTLTVVSGTGATQLNSYTPPAPGSEARTMLGWESTDATVRIIIGQAVNGATMQFDNKKAPAFAAIATEFSFEIPSSGFPFTFYTAGPDRA
jgi:hypothetical protein